MSWYYHQSNGDIVELTGWQAAAQNTEITLEAAAAKVSPSPQYWYGPFGSQAEAQAFKTAHPSVVAQIQGTISGVESNVVSPAVNVAVKLTIRLAEAAVGIVLLAVAANAILKQTTGVDVARTARRAATKTAGTAAKAAVVA